MAPAISVSELRKAFGHTRALDGLDLEVAAGEVHGFLGPNGSGKSTTIRRWLLDLSPFTHAPKLPGADLAVAPLLALTAIATALGAAGLAGVRRRDIG